MLGGPGEPAEARPSGLEPPLRRPGVDGGPGSGFPSMHQLRRGPVLERGLT